MDCANDLCKRPVSQPRYCPGCKKIAYCSQQCRLDHWYAGHQLCCGVERVESGGRFRLQDFEELEQKGKVLGKGSYGEVRLMLHTPTQQKFALKVVLPTQINKAQFQRQNNLQVMKREILLHRQLDHPNIIKLHDHMEDNDNVYLVLEYADRGSLFYEIRRQKRLSEDKARTYFRQVCEGVQYLHENDIIHRDIKPENILLDSTGCLKICDFGWCAKGTETRTTFCGTLDYMAPEMVMGAGHTFAVDIWALGVLLFELVHGTAPFIARKDADKCQQILGLTYSIDPSFSPDLRDLISSLIKAAPEERLPLSQVLSHPWLLGRTKDETLLGVALKNYVKGYGIAEGVVTAVGGEYCDVFYQVPGVTEKMAVARVAKIVKRKNALTRQQTLEELEKEPVAARKELELSPRSPLEQSDEAALLDRIDQWCKAPPKVAVKDKFMEALEESNKQLEESLMELSQKGKGKAEADPSLAARMDLTAVGHVNPPSIPIFDDETPGEDSGTALNLKLPHKGETSEVENSAELRPVEGWAPGGVFSSRASKDRFGLSLQESESYKAEVMELHLPEQNPIVSKPLFNQIDGKTLSSHSSVQPEERHTASFSAASSVQGQLFDFEYERQLIEEKNQLFYSQTEEKWANRSSKESVVHAPVIKTRVPQLDPASTSLIAEIENLAAITKRDPFDPSSRLHALDQANLALQSRKHQLESLLKDTEAPAALPRVRRVSDPAFDGDSKGGFLRWIGSVIGCAERAK